MCVPRQNLALCGAMLFGRQDNEIRHGRAMQRRMPGRSEKDVA